ncbi:MAG TPA: phospholipase D-like domain-containing protein [Streptosporangiaceae bacterium]|nr:phospholipase D-like domain-containing protein [Streptosporangiaceae bacterium]
MVWSSTSFTYTHQKTITVDSKESYISTGNFDTTYYATSRDYGVFDTNAADVSAITAVFNADYAHTSITPSDGTDLVWSPTDSQTQLAALVNGATKSLDVEQEEFSDTTLVNDLVAAAKRGVTVRVVLESPSSYSSEVSEVENAGGQVTGYSSSTGFYIHAKTIIADYGTAGAKAFAGSENFSSNSLNDNRELGLITTDSGVVSGLESTFNGDFTGSAANKVAIITWTVGSGTGSGCTAAQLLGNPGFETGTAFPWAASSGVIADSSKEPPHSGTWTPGSTATARPRPTRWPRR